MAKKKREGNKGGVTFEGIREVSKREFGIVDENYRKGKFLSYF